MTNKEIIEKVKSMPWRPWLHRRFSPLVTYLMLQAGTKKSFQKEGLDAEFPIALYDTEDWYCTDEMFVFAADQAEKFLKQKDIFQLTKRCEQSLEDGRKIITSLIEEKNVDPLMQFKTFFDSLSGVLVSIFVAHAAEAYYLPLLREAVTPFVSSEEKEKYIGDICFPSKKNVLALLEDDVRAGVSLFELHEKYAWIKARGAFLPGYTLEEMKEVQEHILSEAEVPRSTISVPPELQILAKEVQELVYLRTLRTDALWELFYLATPIFARVEKQLGIESVKDYLPEDLFAGKLNKIPYEYAVLKYYDDVIVVHESIVKNEKVQGESVSGVVAQKGFATGTVKVVLTPAEIGKIQDGDILVTNMTIPAYVSAMKKSAAFVTDEGGITCHAAILAREMKKPCVIGTKFATKFFKDGDVVEVDANKGIVRKM